jgi:opacity protein-like surface antigen
MRAIHKGSQRKRGGIKLRNKLVLLAAMLAMMLIVAAHATAQVVNTGNVVNQQGAVQYSSEVGDIEVTGSRIGSN